MLELTYVIPFALIKMKIDVQLVYSSVQCVAIAPAFFEVFRYHYVSVYSYFVYLFILSFGLRPVHSNEKNAGRYRARLSRLGAWDALYKVIDKGYKRNGGNRQVFDKYWHGRYADFAHLVVAHNDFKYLKPLVGTCLYSWIALDSFLWQPV